MDKKDNQVLFKRAVESVDDSQILVVGSDSDIKEVEKLELPKMVRVLVNTSDTSYSNQVNLAVKDVKTQFFSVLEYDDTYTPIWFTNVEEYIEKDTEDTFAFLPLTEVVDVKMGPIGFANEAVWASSFSEELGCYDLQCLEDYLDFNMSGAIFNTEDFIALGALKSSMKLTFWYEFLMRALYKGKRFFVIPKIGYNHFVGREDALSSIYGNNMSEAEANWWINLAKKEYFFPHDRNKIYQGE
jgi:hypothetical protein